MKSKTRTVMTFRHLKAARWLALCLPLAPAAQAADTWDGGGDDALWSNATNWVGDVAPTLPASLIFAGSTRLTPANDLTEATVTNLAFAAGAGAFTLGGNAITLGGNVSVGVAAGVPTNNQAINMPLALDKNVTLTAASVGGSNASKGALVINGPISGPFGLTTSGKNYVQLNGTNTYSGDTTVTSSGGDIYVSLGSDSAFGSGRVKFGATAYTSQLWATPSGGDRVVTNDADILTVLFIAHNATVAGKAPGGLTLSGNIRVNASSGFYVNANYLTLSGPVSGGSSAANVFELRSGKLNLWGNNTFTNTLIVTNPGYGPARVLNINSDASLGHTNNGVRLQTSATIQLPASTNVVLAPSRMFNITSNYVATFDIPAGASLTLHGPVTNSGAVAKSNSGALTFAGPVVNGGGVTLHNGTLTLSGVNTYSGGTIVKGGVLNIATNAALGAENNPLTFTAAATLRGGATNVSLAADRTLNLTNAGAYTVTLDVPTDFTLAMAGPIKGNVATNSSLNKTGPGTLILTGGSGGAPLGTLVTAAGKLSIQSGVWSVAPLLQADGSGFHVSGGAIYEQTGGTNTIPIYAHICNYPSGSSLTSTGMLSGGVMSGMELMVGRRSSGVLTVSGNALLDLYSLKLGDSTNYTSIVNLDGGTVACYHIASRATNSTQATSILNLNGGTIRAKGVAGGLIGGTSSGSAWPLTQINVKNGGAVIDSQSFAVTIPQILSHDAELGTVPDGGLTKRGTCTLTLTTNNTFTGVAAVEAGTLKLGVANTLAADVSAFVASNAVLDVNGKAQTLATLSGSGLVTNNSLLAVTAGVAPGGTNATGTLKLAATPASLSGTLVVDVATNGLCDRLHVNGDLNIIALNLSVANPSALQKYQKYVIASWTGTLAGPFLSAPLPSRWLVKYDTAAREVSLGYDFGTLIMVR